MSFLKVFLSSITDCAILFRCLANTIIAITKTLVRATTMKLVNLQSQCIHIASTMCKSCCAHLRNQSCTCGAVQRDNVKAVFVNKMQCNYYLLRKISFRALARTCAEVAITIHTCLHRIAASGLQAFHKCVITFLQFLQNRIKHCCVIDTTRSLNLMKKRKSQFSEKNISDTRFDAESLRTYRNHSSHVVQTGCESIMNASCITFVVAGMKL